MRLLLVDDHALFLAGMENFLKMKGFNIAGIAHDGAEAQMKYEILKPDLVLMDLQMKDIDGIETTRAIKKEFPEARIIILTAIEEQETLFSALDAGAEGYLLKDTAPEVFVRHLQNAISGELAFSGTSGKRLVQEFILCKQKLAKQTTRTVTFTDRQIAILRCLISGLSYKETADQLAIKEPSVKYQVKEMISKCKLSNRTQLFTYVVEHGVFKRESS